MDLAVDDPLVQDADYRFDTSDRQYIDEQARGSQQHIVDALIRSKHATYCDLLASSASVNVGDTVCLASINDGGQEPKVTKCTAAALANAIAVTGVVLRAGTPGGKVLIAIGGLLPPVITNLGVGNKGFVRVNTTTSKLERVATFGGGDFGIGYVDNGGNMQVVPGIGSASTSPVSLPLHLATPAEIIGITPVVNGGLNKTTSDLAGQANKVVTVNGGETGYTFTTPATTTGADNVGTGSGVVRDITSNTIHHRSIKVTGGLAITQNADDLTIDASAVTGTGGATPAGAIGDIQTKAGTSTFGNITGTDGDAIRRRSGAWVNEPGLDAAGSLGNLQIKGAGNTLSSIAPGSPGDVLTVVSGAWASAPPSGSGFAVSGTGIPYVISSVLQSAAKSTLDISTDVAVGYSGAASGGMLVHNGTKYVNTAKGTANQFWRMDGAGTSPGWTTVALLAVAGSTSELQSNSGGGTLAAVTNVKGFSGGLSFGSGTLPTVGVLRFNGSSQPLLTGENSGGTDYNSLVYYDGTSNALYLGADNTIGKAVGLIKMAATTSLTFGLTAANYVTLSSSLFQNRFPIVGDSSVYGHDGRVVITMVGGSKSLVASEYSRKSIKFTNAPLSTATATFPASATDDSTYVKFLFNNSSNSLTVANAQGSISLSSNAKGVYEFSPDGITLFAS